MVEKIIWIGNRESELVCSDLCYKSLTIYGSNKGSNVSYIHNNSNNSILTFFIDAINDELKYNECKLFFYSNLLAKKIIKKVPQFKQYVVNKFDSNLLEFVDDKTYAHLWASNYMPIIEFTEMFGVECSYNNIHEKFPDYDKYVIQNNHSSGGAETFLLTSRNKEEAQKHFDNHICYIVSPYYEHSFSVNTHIIISENYVSVLPGSIQIIENINNRLLYKGADFIAYKKIPDQIKSKVTNYAKIVGNALKNAGYIGVLGLDLLVQDNEVYFLEINPRFQASSILINRASKDNNYPDLQTIIYNIYSSIDQTKELKALENTDIKYSTLSFYQSDFKEYNSHLLKKLKIYSDNVDCIFEENTNTVIEDDYMFRAVFKTNISSINYDGKIFVYQNLLNYSKFVPSLYSQNFDMLKCALLTQGVIIESDVYELFTESKTIKKATFDAIDVIFENNSIINCPIGIKFVELTPFSIRKLDSKLGLFYFDCFIHYIEISLQEQMPKKYTENNIYIHRIGYLTTDRLRIKHTSNCLFKRQHTGCKFCHITSKSNDPFSLQDIYETIDCYSKAIDFRHFLIGGPSNTYESEGKYIIKIAQYIRRKSKKPIYVMSIPPKSPEVIHKYYESGVNEVAFNIEIFDRNIAKQLMPGKGAIPLEQYETALKESSQLFGIENTRSMLIIGLDSRISILNGVEYLCKIGVTPMISPFRPMFKTEMSDYVPPTIDYIYEIYLASKDICKKYNIELGPKCKYCRNNTLA